MFSHNINNYTNRCTALLSLLESGAALDVNRNGEVVRLNNCCLLRIIRAALRLFFGDSSKQRVAYSIRNFIHSPPISISDFDLVSTARQSAFIESQTKLVVSYKRFVRANVSLSQIGELHIINDFSSLINKDKLNQVRENTCNQRQRKMDEQQLYINQQQLKHAEAVQQHNKEKEQKHLDVIQGLMTQTFPVAPSTSFSVELLQESEETGDCMLIWGDKSYERMKVHKIVFKRFEFFQNLFELPKKLEQEVKESLDTAEGNEIDLRSFKFPKKIIELFVEWSYTATFEENLNNEDIIQLFSLADCLSIDKLQNHCKDELNRRINSYPELFLALYHKYTIESPNIRILQLLNDQFLTFLFPNAENKDLIVFFYKELNGSVLLGEVIGKLIALNEGLLKLKRKQFLEDIISLLEKEVQFQKPNPKILFVYSIINYFNNYTSFQQILALEHLIKNLEIASEIGFSPALYALGYIWRHERINYSKALVYYERAAKEKEYGAMNALAYLYDTGIGGIVKVDKKMAIDLYQQAAAGNHPSAIYNLGCAYLDGDGMEKDLLKAQSFLERAAYAGHLNAKKWLKVANQRLRNLEHKEA